MVGKERSGERPFKQSRLDIEAIRPTFAGPHYRFTLLLPVTEKFEEEKTWKAVFTQREIDQLERKFDAELRGATISKGPIVGSWRNDYEKTVFNQHVKFEVYTTQHEKALEYFIELKVELLQRAKEDLKMPQDDIVIERVMVDFVPQNKKEKLKNLKR